MSNDDRSTQPVAQLHGVFQGCQRLFATVVIRDGQPSEVGRVNRKSKISFGSKNCELLTLLLFPGKTLGERQLQRSMALIDQLVEEYRVLAVFWR